MSVIPTTKNSVLPVDQFPLLDLLAAMAKAIRDDAALNAWCLEYYGQAVTVSCGSDSDNPPGASSYPLVELLPLRDNIGREIDRHERGIGMVCGLHDAELDEVVYSGMTMQQGVLRLEEFYRLVLAAGAGADLSDGYVASVDAMRDQETLFPYFLLGADITVVKPL